MEVRDMKLGVGGLAKIAIPLPTEICGIQASTYILFLLQMTFREHITNENLVNIHIYFEYICIAVFLWISAVTKHSSYMVFTLILSPPFLKAHVYFRCR